MNERDKYILSVVAQVLKDLDTAGKSGILLGFVLADDEGPAYLPMPSGNLSAALMFKRACQEAIIACARGIETGQEISDDKQVNLKNIFAPSQS
jgi:hypothetical protein